MEKETFILTPAQYNMLMKRRQKISEIFNVTVIAIPESKPDNNVLRSNNLEEEAPLFFIDKVGTNLVNPNIATKSKKDQEPALTFSFTLAGKDEKMVNMGMEYIRALTSPEILQIFQYNEGLRIIFENDVWINCIEKIFCIIVSCDRDNCSLTLAGREQAVEKTEKCLQDMLQKFNVHKRFPKLEKSLQEIELDFNFRTTLRRYKHIALEFEPYSLLPLSIKTVLLNWINTAFRSDYECIDLFSDVNTINSASDASVIIIDSDDELETVRTLDDSEKNSELQESICEVFSSDALKIKSDNCHNDINEQNKNDNSSFVKARILLNSEEDGNKFDESVCEIFCSNSNTLQSESNECPRKKKQRRKKKIVNTKKCITSQSVSENNAKNELCFQASTSCLPENKKTNDFISFGPKAVEPAKKIAKFSFKEAFGNIPRNVPSVNQSHHKFAPSVQRNPRRLRPIMIDGSNIAYSHGQVNKVYSCRGISLCIEYFLKRGHSSVTAFVPQYRRSSSNEVSDRDVLEELAKKQLVVFTPSRRINQKIISSYDDRFIVELAFRKGGVIVSNDNFRDLMRENPEWRETILMRLLMYVFVGDEFMVPNDPLGKDGPLLDDFLSFPE